MKITQALLGEHGAFYAQFDHLEHAMPAADSLALIQAQGALSSGGGGVRPGNPDPTGCTMG
ncbi:MAG: hypothetical protein ACE5LU_10785 [Anaerolineae bacterium]